MKTQLALWGLRAVRRLERVQIPAASRAAYAFAFLFALTLALGAANLLFTAWWVGHTQAAQQRQGQLVERKICVTLDRLTALQPPAGRPAVNPSRGFDQQLHAALAQLGPDLGCR